MNNPQLYLLGYLEYQQGRGLSEMTVKRSEYLVRRFLNWLADTDIRSVERRHIAEYREYLQTRISRFTKKRLKPASIQMEMSTLKVFFEYLLCCDYILANPAEGMSVKQAGAQTLRAVFSEEDIVLFLDNIEVTTCWGQRDRALFELMYSSGLRVGEARHLECESVNLEERILLVKAGKGKKDRYVPFSQTALWFLLLYLGSGRKRQENRTTEKRYLFLGRKGNISYGQLSKAFKKYLKNCGFQNKGYTIHSIRHATGTHLLVNGASIRYVQELLGHEDLKTTQLYTRPTIENIKRIYRTYHPRENEYYREVDAEYKSDIQNLITHCEWAKKKVDFRRKHGHSRGIGRWKGKTVKNVK